MKKNIHIFFKRYFYFITGTLYVCVLAVVLYASVSFLTSSFLAVLPNPRPPILPETFHFEEYQEIEHWVGVPLRASSSTPESQDEDQEEESLEE